MKFKVMRKFIFWRPGFEEDEFEVNQILEEGLSKEELLIWIGRKFRVYLDDVLQGIKDLEKGNFDYYQVKSDSCERVLGYTVSGYVRVELDEGKDE